MSSAHEQQYKHMAHFSPYGQQKQSHLVPKLSPRQHEEINSVMSVHLIELRVGNWSSPPGMFDDTSNYHFELNLIFNF